MAHFMQHCRRGKNSVWLLWNLNNEQHGKWYILTEHCDITMRIRKGPKMLYKCRFPLISQRFLAHAQLSTLSTGAEIPDFFYTNQPKSAHIGV